MEEVQAGFWRKGNKVRKSLSNRELEGIEREGVSRRVDGRERVDLR